MGDDDRNRILARRAKFVAAAIASLAVGACKPQPPEVCLSAQPCLSQQPEPEPQACLSVAPRPEPEADGGQPVEPEPQVCLSQPMPLEPEKKPGPFADPPPGKS